MQKSRTCLTCGVAYHANAVSCPNGHEQRARDSEPVAEKTCSFNDHGLKCRNQGILSPGDKGTGPWYCRPHAWAFLGGERSQPAVQTRDTQAEAEQFCKEHGLDTVDKMRDFIKTGMQGMSAKAGNLDWARRIMTNHADGKNIPQISLSKAREALGL